MAEPGELAPPKDNNSMEDPGAHELGVYRGSPLSVPLIDLFTDADSEPSSFL